MSDLEREIRDLRENPLQPVSKVDLTQSPHAHTFLFTFVVVVFLCQLPRSTLIPSHLKNPLINLSLGCLLVLDMLYTKTIGHAHHMVACHAHNMVICHTHNMTRCSIAHMLVVHVHRKEIWRTKTDNGNNNNNNNNNNIASLSLELTAPQNVRKVMLVQRISCPVLWPLVQGNIQ